LDAQTGAIKWASKLVHWSQPARVVRAGGVAKHELLGAGQN
jgi:hypothetical protein